MNKQTCQQREESGIHLMTLVRNHHAEILGREEGNNKFFIFIIRVAIGWLLSGLLVS